MHLSHDHHDFAHSPTVLTNPEQLELATEHIFCTLQVMAGTTINLKVFIVDGNYENENICALLTLTW